jgi:hypothetical protein
MNKKIKSKKNIGVKVMGAEVHSSREGGIYGLFENSAPQLKSSLFNIDECRL